MKKVLLTIFLLLALYTTKADYFFENGKIFVPGVRLGYAFGKNGGFTYGLEFSYGKITDKNINNSNSYGVLTFYGIVANIDFVKTKFRFTLSGEFQYWPYPGINLGPSILVSKDKVLIGINADLYMGLGFLNYYYGLTYFTDAEEKDTDFLLHEMGGSIKIPIAVDNNSIFR